MPEEIQGTKKTYDSSIEEFYRKLIMGDNISAHPVVSDEEIILIEHFNKIAKNYEYLPNFSQGKLREYFAAHSNETIGYNALILGICNEYDIPIVNNSEEKRLIEECISVLLNTEVDIPSQGKDKILTKDEKGYIKIVKFPTDQTEAKLINEKIKEVFKDCKKKLKYQKVIREQYALDVRVRKNDENTFEILKNNNEVEANINLTSQELQAKKEFLLNGIIEKITYHSASASTEIFIEQDAVYVSGLIIPLSIYKKMLEELPNIVEKAMQNCLTYLPDGQVTLYSDDNTKYILSTNSIHILGLDNELFKQNGIIDSIIDYSFSIDERDAPPIYTVPQQSYIKLKNYNLLQKLGELKQLDEKKGINYLSQKVTKLIECQNTIYKIMTSPKEEQDILAWLYYEKYGPKSLNEQYDATEFENRITTIILENEYRFSEQTKNLFKKGTNLTLEEKKAKQNIIKGVSERYSDKKNIEMIVEAFNYIKAAEKYLVYLKQKYSKEVLMISESDIEIFDKELGIETIDDVRNYFFNNTFKDKAGLNLGYLGLAHIAIKQAITDYKNKNELKTLINLFKVKDKLLYLCNFNYPLGIRKIYITDLQFEDNVDILCEIEAFGETFFSCFENVNEKGIAKFYSAQSSKDKFIIKSVNSGTDILIGLSEGKSNIITQAHSKVKKSKLTVQGLIDKLKANQIELRYAPAFDVKTTPDKKGLLFFRGDKILDDTDKRVLSLEESKSVIEWITNVNQEEFENFSGLKVEDINKLNEIKLLLIHNLNTCIKDLISKRIIEIDNYINDINTEIDEKTRDMITYTKNIELDLGLRVFRYRKIESDLLKERQKLMDRFGVFLDNNISHHASANRVIEITKEILYDNQSIESFINLLNKKEEDNISYQNLIIMFPLLTLDILANKTNSFQSLTSEQQIKLEELISDIFLSQIHVVLQELLGEYIHRNKKNIKEKNALELRDEIESIIMKKANYAIGIYIEKEYLKYFPTIYNRIKMEKELFVKNIGKQKEYFSEELKRTINQENIREMEGKYEELERKINDSFLTGTFTCISHR